MSSATKEITESLGFGVIFATIKAAIDYASGKENYPVLSRQEYGHSCRCGSRLRLWEKAKMVSVAVDFL